MIVDFQKIQEKQLIHFGIPGMHWGRRQSDHESTETENARKKVLKNKQFLKREKRSFHIETKNGLLAPTKNGMKKLASAKREYKYSKEDLEGSKILDWFESRNKSKTQINMEEKYKLRGMTDDEATIAAYQHIRTKKILIGIGGTVLALGGAYAAYKIHDTRVDKIIKSGTLLQNISPESNIGIRDAFYSSKNKLDNVKYKGIYGDTLNNRSFWEQTDGAFKKEIKVLSDIKQASPKRAQNILSELIKTDPEFADDVHKYISDNKDMLGGVYDGKMRRAEATLSKGLFDKNTYEVFNASLVVHSPEMQRLTDRYFNELSKNGYNAIKDVNDSKYSGYKSINPIIAFNSLGKVAVVDVKKLTDNEIQKAKKLGVAAIATPDAIKFGSIIVASIFGGKTSSYIRDEKLNRIEIQKYRTEHPKTKLTNTEIIRMIERSR